MAIDTKQYLEELFKSAGVSDDNVKQAVSNFFSNETVSKRLGDDILRQQDYSRNMDSLRVEQQKAAAEREKSVNYYTDLLNWKATEEAKLQAIANGSANGEGQRNVVQPVQGDFISKKEFDAKFQEQGTSFVNLLKDAMALTSTHVYEFKEPLDTEALTKIAVERQIPIRQAYDEFVAPRRAEASKALRDTELAKAREEGAREYASKHKLPVDSQPREYHVMLDRDPSKQAGGNDYVPNSGKLSPAAERALRDGFAEEWNRQPAGSTSGT